MIPETTARRIGQPKRRGTRGRSVIEAAKEAVATIDLADRLLAESGGRWRKVGDEWTTNCVLPGHADRSPSFTVNPDENVWFCHGCLRGGDVIELAQRAWDIDRADVAAAEVLLTFGHPVPERPPTWFRKQERQAEVRQAVEEAKIAHLRRRVFRRFMALLEAIEDDQERLEETERLWEAAWEIAALMWAGRGTA